MVGENRTRFKTMQEALRFYFRMIDAVGEGRFRCPASMRFQADASNTGESALADYRSIGACLSTLGDAEFIALSEFYGPGWFDARHSGIERARDAMRRAFPWRRYSLRMVAALHRDAIVIVRRRLIGRGMTLGTDSDLEPLVRDASGGPDLFRRLEFPVRLGPTPTAARRTTKGGERKASERIGRRVCAGRGGSNLTGGTGRQVRPWPSAPDQTRNGSNGSGPTSGPQPDA